MRFLTILAMFCATSGPLAAQEIIVTPLDDVEVQSPLQPLDELIGELTTIPFDDETTGPTEAPRVTVANGAGGALRVLDKLTGAVTDLTLNTGESADLGFLNVALSACRYPVDNPSGDAFAYVQVRDRKEDAALFAGWMLGSAPALNAMDHPRYDVWALRCITSEADDT